MSDTIVPDLLERSRLCLQSDRRLAFLGALVFRLTIAARAYYPWSGAAVDR